MNSVETMRMHMLTATVPFVQAVSQLPGVRRVALIGGLSTTKPNPKDVDLLLTVEDTMDLSPLATLGRKFQGRLTALTRTNVGADLFLATPQHRYLGRLCHHKDCPGYRSTCQAQHCGRRPYLRDDLRHVTLERTLVITPPLDLWPTIIVRVVIPPDVEQYLLRPLIAQLDLPRSEQMIPRSVRDRLITSNGMIDHMALAALYEAAAFLDVMLTQDVVCNYIEIQPLERYAPMLHFPEIHLGVARVWVVELEGKICFVAQGIQEGAVVFLAR